jgi:hypothetical protein
VGGDVTGQSYAVDRKTVSQRLMVIVAGFACLVFVSGCHDEALTPRPPQRSAGRFSVDASSAEIGRIESWIPEGREKQLTDSFLARYSGEHREVLRQILAKRQSRLEVTTDSASAALVEEIYKARHATIMAHRVKPPTIVEATVVLVDKLPSPNAAAVIVRRTKDSPHDLILLPTAAANAEVLQAAVDALYDVRAKTGDSASSNMRIPVSVRVGHQGATTPRANRALADLIGSTPRYVDGFGMVRAIEIPLVGNPLALR